MTGRVAILQHRLLHYRTELFQQLRDSLKTAGVELDLIHGQASPAEKVRRDEGELHWATVVKNNFWTVFGRDLIWQHLPATLGSADLIVLMQENRILSNYPIQLRRRGQPQILAFWGHGKNFQSTAPNGVRERWKSYFLDKVDWWFSYTSMTTDLLIQQGFPAERITTLQNAIDVSGFRKDLASVAEEDIERARKELGLEANAMVGLFCGSLYPEKRIELLLASAHLIRRALPTFHLIVVGDGPSGQAIREASTQHDWIHFMGVQRGKEKALFFRLAHVQLNPGLVGLHVLDAFCAGVPMITTATALHSPEIAYLESGVNGIVCESDDPSGYSEAVIRLLSLPALRDRMARECSGAAVHYTLENMVGNFSDGVLKCLRAGRRQR